MSMSLVPRSLPPALFFTRRTLTRVALQRLLLLTLLPFLPVLGRDSAHAADAVVVATMPEARSGAAVVWTGSKAYIFGGTDGLTNFTSILEFDPATAVVARTPDNLPIGVHQFSAVWTGSSAYTFGGARFQVADCGGCESVAAIQEYSPDAQPTSAVVAQLPSLRHAAPAIWDGNHAFMFGGITGMAGGHLDEIIRFDPATLSVTTMSAHLSHPRDGFPAVLTPYGAYLFGGYRQCSGDTSCDDIEKYDPSTDTVTLLSTKLPQRLSFASAVWSGRFIYIFGGGLEPGPLLADQILRFDPTDESITVLPDRLPAPWSAGDAFWDGHSAYIVGGSTAGGPSNQILRYDPSDPPPNCFGTPQTSPTPRIDPITGAVLPIYGYQLQPKEEEWVRFVADQIVPELPGSSQEPDRYCRAAQVTWWGLIEGIYRQRVEDRFGNTHRFSNCTVRFKSKKKNEQAKDVYKTKALDVCEPAFSEASGRDFLVWQVGLAGVQVLSTNRPEDQQVREDEVIGAINALWPGRAVADVLSEAVQLAGFTPTDSEYAGILASHSQCELGDQTACLLRLSWLLRHPVVGFDREQPIVAAQCLVSGNCFNRTIKKLSADRTALETSIQQLAEVLFELVAP